MTRALVPGSCAESNVSNATRTFIPLEQDDFRRLQHAASLKGLLKPFKGKGDLEVWARECLALRDALIALGQERVLAQMECAPYKRLPVELAQQTTGAGTAFLRWRKPDRSVMGVALWQAMIADPATPQYIRDDLYVIEVQRVVLNMQVSLLHTLTRQALECASKVAQAEQVLVRQYDHRTVPP